MASTPSSVSFCTTHSGRSPFTGANATVMRGSARHDSDVAGRLQRRPEPCVTPPPNAVADGQRITWLQPEDSEVMAIRIRKLERLEIVDEDVRAVAPVRPHLNAERIFENSPVSAGATSSPRSSAS